MNHQELLTETVETSSIGCWNNESAANVLRALAVGFSHRAGERI
jgi:hypothetical protein